MDNDKVYTTSLRLYKKRPVHMQAYRCLKNYNTDIFKTKDDYIAEAIIHFSRYLKQEEDVKQIRIVNDCLEHQQVRIRELIASAVEQVQNEKMPDIIKKAVADVMQGKMIQTDVCEGDSPSYDDKEPETVDWEKDMEFAQFYDMDED